MPIKIVSLNSLSLLSCTFVLKTNGANRIMRKLIITLLLATGLSISSLSLAEVLKIKPNAPTRYTVVKGDTLWGISGRYLYKPWNWPKLWGWNKVQIRNPHLIYPGQVLVLTYVDGQPRLGVEGGFRKPKDGPKMRVDEKGDAINGISYDAIKRFYKRPLIITEAEFNKAPRIVSGPESRLVLTRGDRVYARGITEPGLYSSFKANKKIYDPDTGKFIGFEVSYGGDLSVQKLTGEVQTLEVVGNDNEMLVGDRLVKVTDNQDDNFIPHGYEEATKGKVVSLYEAALETGVYSTITINMGKKQGVENGHVFGIYRSGNKTLIRDVDNVSRTVEMPAEEIGILMVYRTFEDLSYAVIMSAKSEIRVGNLVGTPGLDMEYFDNNTIHQDYGDQDDKKKK